MPLKAGKHLQVPLAWTLRINAVILPTLVDSPSLFCKCIMCSLLLAKTMVMYMD